MTNLSSPPETIEALTYAGFDEMTVATNHIFDCGTIGYCGTQAFEQTLENLHNAGIKTVGGGMNIDEAHQPAIFEINGVKFGVLGYDDISADQLGATATSPGTAGMDDSYEDELAAPPQEPSFYKPASMLHTTRLEADIKALKQQVDVVIVQVQTGFEDTHDASPRSIKALRAAADAGADLVVGNQGHSVQPIEVRGNTFISYALGNFIFDQVHTVDETQGYLLEADFWGKTLANVRMVPYQIQDLYKPMFVDAATSAKIFTDIASGTADLPAPDAVITQ
jgi:poly-gamma-glutamate synthesis protein (capsule biosynthesis protein)